ncbi:cytochrome-c peroxidase [Aureococcus anophagefferens]|nr:cytochrome-c peroxidase [Aureococcus anophagefferens]
MFSRASLLRLIPAAATPVFVASCDEASARSAIAKLIEDSEEKRDDGTSMGPTFVRLAWHSSGTWCAKTKTGGSDGGRMKFCPESRWGANAGLAEARRLIEGAGRSDAADGSSSPPDGRLPDADKGTLKGTVQHLRDIFHRMGFDDKDIVALSGAHALGRCHETASGYWGPWTFAETTFSNEYFRLLLEETWTLKTTHNGHAWTGPDQFEDPSGKLMMLPSDVALLWDKEFRKHVEVYAKDEELFFKDFAAAFAKLLAFGTPGASTGLVGGLKSAVGL